LRHLKLGILGKISETPKEDDLLFKNVNNYVIADYTVALSAMKKEIRCLGYQVFVLEKPVLGKVDKAVDEVYSLIRKSILKSERPFAIIFSSEITVDVSGFGKGGRCQDFGARLMQRLEGFKNFTHASIGSDGIDFLKGVQGVIFDENTLANVRRSKYDCEHYITQNNTYELHKRLGSLILGGPTGTNVGDLHVFICNK
jgi:glycerate-2-kinase